MELTNTLSLRYKLYGTYENLRKHLTLKMLSETGTWSLDVSDRFDTKEKS